MDFWSSLIYLFDDVSTPHVLFNAIILFICEYLIIAITIYIFNVQFQQLFKSNFLFFLIISFFLHKVFKYSYRSQMYVINYSYLIEIICNHLN